MRRLLMFAVLLGSFATAQAADAVPGTSPAAAPATRTARVLKVLPLFLDLQGHDAISPSLFDRDAYQAHLLRHTNEVSAIRFDVLWKAAKARGAKLKLRAELRGVGDQGAPRLTTLETEITPGFFRSWTSLKLAGDDLKNFGSLVAWHVTIWDGDQLLGERQSFLW